MHPVVHGDQTGHTALSVDIIAHTYYSPGWESEYCKVFLQCWQGQEYVIFIYSSHIIIPGSRHDNYLVGTICKSAVQ